MIGMLTIKMVDYANFQRLVSTLTPIQHPDGGFGGGFGQLAHTATSYAAVLSLVTVGGAALDMIDRRAM